MSWTLIAIVLAVIAFAAGTASTLWRSPNHNPLADLQRKGLRTQATIMEFQDDAIAPNVVVQYQVNGQHYTRSIPWSGSEPPALGTQVPVKYLPDTPGLSRLDTPS
jgi:hypothetical protein